MRQPRGTTDKQPAWGPMWVQPQPANHPHYCLPWWTLCNHALNGSPMLSLPPHNGHHCQWVSGRVWVCEGIGFDWAQTSVCAPSISSFKEGARVTKLKRIMIITLGERTLTSLKTKWGRVHWFEWGPQREQNRFGMWSPCLFPCLD